MKISYDKIADVLYITFSAPKERAGYIEIKGGILRIDEDTQQIIGVTIPFFQEKTATSGNIELPGIGPVPFSAETKRILESATARPRLRVAGGGSVLSVK